MAVLPDKSRCHKGGSRRSLALDQLLPPTAIAARERLHSVAS